MTVNDLIKILDARIINLANGDRKIISGYCGDFLSFVMGKAPFDSAWFTVMTNVNVAAVATLTEVAVVVVCEGSSCEHVLKEKAIERCINIVETDLDIFSAVIKLFGK